MSPRHRSDRPAWHPDDCNGACCWADDTVPRLVDLVAAIDAAKAAHDAAQRAYDDAWTTYREAAANTDRAAAALNRARAAYNADRRQAVGGTPP